MSNRIQRRAKIRQTIKGTVKRPRLVVFRSNKFFYAQLIDDVKGHTIAAVDKLGLLDKYSFVSTGGGAMLSFLTGENLAGLEALSYYEN